MRSDENYREVFAPGLEISVDGLGGKIGDLSDNVARVAIAIMPDALPGHDETGGTVASLTESVMGITAALVQIAGAIRELAEAVRERGGPMKKAVREDEREPEALMSVENQ